MIASKNLPHISVLLPVYNAQLFVREAITSILNQSFSDFELIVINDGSQDGSQDILVELRDSDPRIILISRENRGIVDSLNESIVLARGKWIARMDADDISLPDRFEKQLAWLQKTGADICGSWVRLFGSTDKRVIKHPQSDAAIKMALLFGAPFAHPSVMVRAEFLKQLQYEKTWEKCEDYDLWERAARAGWKMANIPAVLLLYRQHGAQISDASTELQQRLTQEVRHRYWSHVCKQEGLDPECVDTIVQMREDSPISLNMDVADEAFNRLLQSKAGEARDVLLDHITRLYFRVAAGCPDIVFRWSRLNSNYGHSHGLLTKLMLFGIAKFHIRAGGDLFRSLKKVFLRISWRS